MSTMSVGTFIRVAPMLPASTSVMLRGDHGIGKSQVVRQVGTMIAEALVATGDLQKVSDMELIDRRLSQMSEGDIVGLPSTDGEVTRFNPPDWYKRACTKPCILFLDELNRATPEVMQAAFQIVLDRELNGWKLHPNTRVFSAINASSSYNVNEVDPALLDRFWVIDLQPDTADFLNWARKENTHKGYGVNCLPVVADFIANDGGDKWLDPPKNVDPGKKGVSRRSWERLGDALYKAGVHESPEHEAFYPICVGYIGLEAAIKFCDFAKSNDARFTGEDIVERYSKVRQRVISKKKAEIMNEACEKVADYVQKFSKVTDKQGKNISAFMKDLPDEHKIALWTKMTKSGQNQLELAKSLHKHVVEQILGVFGVPLGAAGVGVVPNIPSTLKTDNK